MNIEQLRSDARRLMQAARDHIEPEKKQELAARAFELAQQAEIIANLNTDQQHRAVLVARYRSMLRHEELSEDAKRLLGEVLADAGVVLAEAPMTSRNCDQASSSHSKAALSAAGLP